MSDIKRYLCVLKDEVLLLGSTIASDSFGCTSAELEEYITDAKDMLAVRELEVGQRYIDSLGDLWERTP